MIATRQSERGPVRRLIAPVLLLASVITVGAVGYVYLEKLSPVEAIYMAVITVTTVGFREVRPLDPAGQLFTVGLILFGVGAFTYFATSVANYFVAGEIRGLLEQRKMQKEIDHLRDHFVVCGYGRMGQQVAAEFKREGRPLVVIDNAEDAIHHAIENGLLVIQGDAEEDEVLKAAGVARARGLVGVLEHDASNLLVTLSARSMNPNIFIAVRTQEEANTSKFYAAGANRVLFPHGLGGRRIAQMAIRPHVTEFLELVMHDEELALWLEEMQVAIGSRLDGCAIGEAHIRRQTGANIVALRRRTGELLTTLDADTRLQAGDIIVALGTRQALEALRHLTSGAA